MDAHPAWSPDGTQIAFVSDRSTQIPSFDLYIMESDGSNVRSLIPSVGTRGHPPVWSPDGSRIAFVGYASRFDTGSDESRHILYTIRPDGSDLVEIGDTSGNPTWSPDGSRIAFIRKETDTSLGLYTIQPDGSDRQRLSSFEGNVFLWYPSLSWSPDGYEIIYATRQGFTLVTMDGSESLIVAVRLALPL